DEMLNMGFLEDVESILECLSPERKIWMFSATMPQAIKKLVSKNFSEPEFVKTDSKSLANNDIKQCYVVLDQKDHVKGLRRIIETDLENQGIVFSETRESCKRIAEKLQDLGVSALPLHGDLSQAQREYAMGRFKAKKVKLLICTDIASRGIDVNDLKYVFNMGFPRQDDSYVHRIGRTGRAGAQGMAITFCDHREKYRIKHLEKKTGVQMESMALPNIEDLKSAKVATELEKLEGMISALKERGEEFAVDTTYELFRDSLKDLSKEEILKIFFSQKFNKDFRMLEEALQIKKGKPAREGNLRTRSRTRVGRSRDGDSDGERRGRGGRGGSSRGGSRRRSSSASSTSSSSRGERGPRRGR
ncbi:MAG: DEAD/DEAH box helicase, partial [Halobacteriovoraceae bacterium]|nr:DEAD/DEAH box helicase [Halobacteriovoraceae bacterium]